MSAIERNRTCGSSFEGMKPRRRQNSAASTSMALTMSARPPTRTRRRHAPLQGVLEQASSDAASGPAEIGRELAEQQTRHGIGRLACPNGSGKDVRRHRRRREAVIADDTALLVNDENGRKTLFLVGERPGLEPVVEGRLAATEPGNVMGRGQRFGSRKSHDSTLRSIAGLPRRGAFREFHHFRDGSRRRCESRHE